MVDKQRLRKLAQEVVDAHDSGQGMRLSYAIDSLDAEFPPDELLALLSSLEQAEARIGQLQDLCGDVYQMAGVIEAPERFMDALAAAERGLPIPEVELLPVTEEEFGKWEPAEGTAEARIAELEGALRNLLCRRRTGISIGYAEEFEADELAVKQAERALAGKKEPNAPVK